MRGYGPGRQILHVRHRVAAYDRAVSYVEHSAYVGVVRLLQDLRYLAAGKIAVVLVGHHYIRAFERTAQLFQVRFHESLDCIVAHGPVIAAVLYLKLAITAAQGVSAEDIADLDYLVKILPGRSGLHANLAGHRML